MARRTRRKLMTEMNVVPYIDVMLVLLIIFMITAPLVTQGVKVDLPQASSETVPPTDDQPLIVSVDSEGQYFIDFGDDKDAPVDHDTLITRVQSVLKYKPDTPVLVNGDRNVAYQRVVGLMALLQQAGVPSVGLLTEPPE